mmetsp:Transcript_17388/g.20883  ORF Transcript_17388/g.20883 Transcript_17388/m.20883 type:complete len:100 (+) Transcript_17388:1835-2134(+)
MAPELLSKSRTVYDPFAADVFALGVCVFSLLVGRMPFKVALDDHGQILSKSASELLALLGLSQKLSKDAVDLLNKLLAWRPEDRIPSHVILSHRFFADC